MGLGPLEHLAGGVGGCSLTYLALESGKGCRTEEFQKKNVAFRFFFRPNVCCKQQLLILKSVYELFSMLILLSCLLDACIYPARPKGRSENEPLLGFLIVLSCRC